MNHAIGRIMIAFTSVFVFLCAALSTALGDDNISRTFRSPPMQSPFRLRSARPAFLGSHVASILRIPNVTNALKGATQLIDEAITGKQETNLGTLKDNVIVHLLQFGWVPKVLQREKPLSAMLQGMMCNDIHGNGSTTHCADVAAWGTAVGSPIREFVTNTSIAKIVQTAGDAAGNLHDLATRGITKSLVDVLTAQEILITAENVVLDVANKVEQGPFPSVVKVISELPSALVYSPLKGRDSSLWTLLGQNVFRKNKPADPASRDHLCSMIKTPLPFCQNHGVSLKKDVNSSLEVLTEHKLPINITEYASQKKLPYTIHVHGFQKGCDAWTVQGCQTLNSRHSPFSAALFDGIYYLKAVDSANDFPVYIKTLSASERLKVKETPLSPIESFVLWSKVHHPETTNISLTRIFSAITPNIPSFDYSFLGNQYPFAFQQGSQLSEECLTDMSANFPFCLNGSWKLAGVSRPACNGVKVSNDLCLWTLTTLRLQ